MPNPVDLATFKPASAQELFQGILSHVIPLFGEHWAKGKKEIQGHIKTLAVEAFRTQQQLGQGKIDQKDADFLMHMQELYLANILRLAAFLPYVLAQAIRDTVMKVAKAAIKNWTGIDLYL